MTARAAAGPRRSYPGCGVRGVHVHRAVAGVDHKMYSANRFPMRGRLIPPGIPVFRRPVEGGALRKPPPPPAPTDPEDSAIMAEQPYEVGESEGEGSVERRRDR